jgi:polysaccharide chain length determinant protein (PEP-CTERM system associated)
MNQSLDLIRRYLRAAWRRRWIGLGAAWLVCLAGWAGVHQIKDEYQVRARLYVDADAVLTPLLRGIAVDSNPNDQISRLQRTLLSRPNLQTLISKTDLGLAATTADERERLIRRLGTRIKVQSQDKNLFSIEYENADPRLARDVVQTLLSIFTESATSSNRSEMENAQLFLQRQIVSYEKQLHSMEERRAAFRAKYAGVLPVDGVAGGTVETARDAVSRMEVQLQDAEAREAQLQARLKGMPQTLSAGVAGPGGIAPLAQAEAKLSELRTLYTDDYPGVIEQKKLIEQMRRAPEPGQGGTGGGVGLPNQLYDQLVVKLVDEQSNVASLTRQLQAARVSFARIQQIRHDQPSLLAEYENLNRDYGVLRKNYDELVGRLQAATISEAANTQADKVHLRVVDPPEVPLLPIAPNRPLLMTGVLIAGIGVGLGVAVLLAELDSSFTSLDDLRALGLPVLGGLSAIGGPGPRRRVVAGVQFAVGFVLLIGLYGGLVVHTLRASGTV